MVNKKNQETENSTGNDRKEQYRTHNFKRRKGTGARYEWNNNEKKSTVDYINRQNHKK